jgi:hypothetical protein
MIDIEKKFDSNDKKKLFIVWIILLTTWITMTVVPMIFKDKTGIMLVDFGDTSVYFRIGKWLTLHTIPVSEYPQIPTLLFGINQLFSSMFETRFQLNIFALLISMEMFIILFLVFKGLLQILPPNLSNYAFLVLLPPTIYFTYNRFDILPAYLCLLAYIAAIKKEWLMVSILLAVATFTKWYPALLFPGFLFYANRLESKFQWKMVMIYAATSIAILLPSFFQGGLEQVLAPYQFHTLRSMEYVSVPVIISDLIHFLSNINLDIPYYFLFFFILQLSPIILVYLIKLDTIEKLSDYCIIAIGTFVIFSRIWSPQWILWLMPFLVISSRDKRFVAIIIAYNIMVYLCFPILFIYTGTSSYQLKISSLLTDVILLVILIRSLKHINISFRNVWENLQVVPKRQ